MRKLVLLVVSLFLIVILIWCIEQYYPTENKTNGEILTNGEAKLDLLQMEVQIHDLINKKRQENNVASLHLNNKLREIARDHSEDMVVRQFFSHINPDGQSPTDRANKAAYTCHRDHGIYYTGLAENIYQGNWYGAELYYNGQVHRDYNTQEQIVEQTVNAWMNSLGHRTNMLNPDYLEEGIGVALDSNGRVFVTENLC